MRTYNNSIVIQFDTSETGNAGSGKPVTVFNEGTEVKADLFDLNSNPISNPVLADEAGNYTFDVVDGIYDLYIDFGLITQTSILSELISEEATNNLINDLSQAYEFPTVAAFKNFGTLFPDGKIIHLLDRGADFTKITGNTPTSIPDTDVIFSTSVNQSIEIVEPANGVLELVSIGGKGDSGVTNNNPVIARAFELVTSKGYTIGLGVSTNLFGWIGAVTIPVNITFSGDGVLWGAATTGTAPTGVSLRADGSSAARLITLQAYYNAEIICTAKINVHGQSFIRNTLFTSTTGDSFINNGDMITDNCSFHGLGAKAFKKGLIDARTLLICCDGSGIGLHSHLGGTIAADAGITYLVSTGNDSLFVQIGGIINVEEAEIYDCGDNAIFILQSGSITAKNGIIDTSVGHGAIINYGGSIDVSGGLVTNCTKSNLVSESGGAIFAKGTTNTNSGDSGCSTSFGGVINMAEGVTGGHTNFDAFTLGSGFINFRDTTVNGDSNGGGSNIMIRAIGEGIVFAEEPVTGSGKAALVSANYSPGYNTVGNGAAYVGEYKQNDATVFTPIHLLGDSVEKTISSGVITVNRSYQTVDTQGNIASDDLDTINGGIEGMRLVLEAANSSRDVVVKNNTGNIRLDGAADFTLAHANDKIELIFNTNGVWNEVSRSTNA